MGSRPEACISSNVITASGSNALVVATTAGWLCSVNGFVATTGDLYAIAYDSVAAAGTVLYRRRMDSSLVGQSWFDALVTPIAFTKGLTFTITGTAPDGVVVGFVSRL